MSVPCSLVALYQIMNCNEAWRVCGSENTKGRIPCGELACFLKMPNYDYMFRASSASLSKSRAGMRCGFLRVYRLLIYAFGLLSFTPHLLVVFSKTFFGRTDVLGAFSKTSTGSYDGAFA